MKNLEAKIREERKALGLTMKSFQRWFNLRFRKGIVGSIFLEVPAFSSMMGLLTD